MRDAAPDPSLGNTMTAKHCGVAVKQEKRCERAALLLCVLCFEAS